MIMTHEICQMISVTSCLLIWVTNKVSIGGRLRVFYKIIKSFLPC